MIMRGVGWWRGEIKQNHDLAEQYEPGDTSHLKHRGVAWNNTSSGTKRTGARC